jgi:Fe-S cluster biogenesis protein NfuA
MEISNELRRKVVQDSVRLSVIESQELKSVYLQLSGRKQLDLSCPSCVMTAIRIVKNYILYHEVKPVQEVNEEKPSLEGMKLSELRKLDPTIKSNSVGGWIEKYNEKHK